MSDNACLDWFKELSERVKKLEERMDKYDERMKAANKCLHKYKPPEFGTRFGK